jgi:hypothetical protein
MFQRDAFLFQAEWTGFGRQGTDRRPVPLQGEVRFKNRVPVGSVNLDQGRRDFRPIQVGDGHGEKLVSRKQERSVVGGNLVRRTGGAGGLAEIPQDGVDDRAGRAFRPDRKAHDALRRSHPAQLFVVQKGDDPVFSLVQGELLGTAGEADVFGALIFLNERRTQDQGNGDFAEKAFVLINGVHEDPHLQKDRFFGLDVAGGELRRGKRGLNPEGDFPRPEDEGDDRASNGISLNWDGL